MNRPAFQITIDCADPDTLARFWAEALHYDLHLPPEPHATWRSYWISVGVPEEEAGDGFDAIVDPTGRGPRVWFQQVPEAKQVKNRLHFDLLVGGGRSVPLEDRKSRVDAEAGRLTARGAAIVQVVDDSAHNHYFITMSDPEGNEFDLV